jgi:hypothetical protein
MVIYLRARHAMVMHVRSMFVMFRHVMVQCILWLLMHVVDRHDAAVVRRRHITLNFQIR